MDAHDRNKNSNNGLCKGSKERHKIRNRYEISKAK